MIGLIRNNVAIKPIRDPDKSAGGIWIPDQAKERTDQGIVKYLGPACKHVQIGDHVLFSGYSGTTVQFEQDADGTLIILSEKFIVCKLFGPDTEVSGLYFKGKLDPEMYENVKNRVADMLIEQKFVFDSDIEQEEFLDNLIKEIRVGCDTTFEATYEMAMNLIAQSFEGTDFAKNTGFRNPLDARPKKEDYDDDDETE